MIKENFNTLSFQYDQSYDSKLTPLSLSMPITYHKKYKQVFKNWVSNLLPENQAILQSMAKEGHFHENDVFAFLKIYGKDCAGAVQFISLDENLFELNDNKMIEVTETEISDKLVKMLSDSSFSGIEHDEHKSIAGAQQKLTLHYANEKWYRVSGNTPSTHIIKPGIKNFNNESLLEYITMETYRTIGIDVAKCEYRLFLGQPAIVVERYDRKFVNNGWTRIHQEDFCQALGLSSNEKYESDSRLVNIEAFVKLLEQSSGHNARYNLLSFLKICICDYLLGSIDNHAKNHSLILNKDEVTLAPTYDVATIYGSGQEQKYNTFGIKIGKCKNVGNITKDNLMILCGQFNLDYPFFRNFVLEICKSIKPSLEKTLFQNKHISGIDDFIKPLIENAELNVTKIINFLK